jgi:hypothetical protein
VTERPDITVLKPLVGQLFGMGVAPDRWIELELLAVADLGRRPLEDGKDLSCFGLVFRSGTRAHVPQAIYTLRHPALGEMDVFLVPIGPDEVGMRYEAIFN